MTKVAGGIIKGLCVSKKIAFSLAVDPVEAFIQSSLVSGGI